MKILSSIILIVSFIFAVDYQSQIQPIFNANCGNCHLGNSSGGLNLSTYDNLMEGSDDGAVVIPGNHEQSILWDEINTGDMPAGNNPELSNGEIDLIAQWIDEGASFEESTDVVGCTDSNAISCDDDIDALYFPACDTCSDDEPCDNYYNPNATIDNNMCMYDDVPLDNQFIIEYFDVGIDFSSGFSLDWSAFTPPVEIIQYVLQRCADPDGDTDGDGELEFENCSLIIDQDEPYYLDTTFFDEYEMQEDSTIKFTLYVHYPNNNYWGSAHRYYYYDAEPEYMLGDINFDDIINVIDIVSLVNYIVGGNTGLDDLQLLAADFNEDGMVNVLDVVNIVNYILN